MILRDRCPCCESPDFHTVLREPYSRGPVRDYLTHYYHGRALLEGDFHYELVQCVECKLVYQRAVPAPTLLADVYERWISPEEDKPQLTLDDRAYMAEQVQFVIRYFKRPACVLDFGMGWAQYLSMARAFGCEAYGAELSQERVNYAASIGLSVIDIFRDGILFDFINAEQVFEHLVHPLVILKRLTKLLKPTGLLRISVPNGSKAIRRVIGGTPYQELNSEEVMALAPVEHINSFTHDSLVRFCEHAGLKLIRPRLRDIWASSSGWAQPKTAIRLFARPIYRHVWPRSTVGYFAAI
jgi:Methyltransferase domain